MNIVTDINVQKEVSCRVTNSVFKYLESKGYNCDSITDGLPYPYSREYLSDPLNWVTYEIRETICRRAAELTNDDAVMFKVGLSIPIFNTLGGVESVARKLTGPKMVYRLLPKYARLLDRVFTFKTTITGKNTATIEMRTEEPEYNPSKDSCYFAQGILAAVPTLWGLPPAEIHEKKCMYMTLPGTAKEGVQYQAETCVYEVNWQPLPSWFQRFRDNVIGRIRMIPGVTNFKELEQSLRNIDQKNIELTARNSQLAIVREIAMGVGKVRTIDEALTLAVEQAREIEGIRFVLVQSLDESGEYITTPYYSKIRPHSNAMNPLKALGIDPEKLLGKNPTSNKLRLEVSKIKIAQDYLNNPQVIVMPSLADLLDGIWPRALCNAIQTILKVKKLVMVPLLAENKLWGNILYFLTQDVPIDILEMIGTHCGLALNNIINLNSLVSRNTELIARNKQLAAVREIALGVDKVRTIDEALSFAVEQAKEIEGIRFVLVQKLDEAKEFVITPYYSKIRPQNRFMVDAIKALGFDPDKELGKNPTSNKLRFRFSKLKAAQDYVRNPRVMVFPSIAELLDGILPRTLCNGIQKILGVKKLVVVPIIVEGESWGSLLFFLTQDVPIDILEMIGAHCGLAVRNIGYIEALAAEAVRKRILIDESLDGIVILDDNAAVVEANQRFAEMLGYSPEEVRKLHTWDWDIKWKPETLLEMGRTVGSGSEGLHIETQHRRKDGTLFDVDISVNGAVCDGQKLIFCVCRDVTERKKVEEALQKEQTFLSNVLSSIQDSITVLDNKLNIISANKALEKQFAHGMPFIGKKCYEAFHNRSEPCEACPTMQTLETGKAANQVVPRHSPDGMITGWSELHTFPIFDTQKGEITGIIEYGRDITERRRMVDALQESEEKFRNLFEHAKDMIVLVDTETGIILDINTAGCNLLGLPKEKIIGRNQSELHPPELADNYKKLFRSHVQKGGFENDNVLVQVADGRQIPMDVSASVVKLVNKTVIQGVFRDVTERVKMERALKESEEKFSKAFHNLPEQVTIARVKDNTFVDVNESFCRYNGYTREEVIGRKREELNLLIGPSQRDQIAKMVKERGRFKNIELECKDKSGETRTLLFSTDLINLGGEPCQLTIANDITERKQIEQALKESEEKFSKAFHASPEAIALITAKDEKYIDINDSYTKMTGYSREELIGNNAFSINLWVSDENHNKMHKMMREQGRIYNEEFDYRTKSGEIRTRLFSLEPITINGEPCTIGVSTDITERRRIVEALRESEDRYRTIFKSANDVLILMDNKGKIIDVNDRITDIGGYNREELIGKNIRSLSNMMTKKSLLIIVGNFLKRMAGLEVLFYDVEMIKKNGEHLIIQINAIAVHKEGKIIGDLAVLRDVTEIRQAEKNLKLQKDLIDRILATIPNAVLLLNRNLNVIIANQTFYNLFKLKKNQVESKPFDELIISPDLDQAIKKVLGSKEEKTNIEFRYHIGSSEKMLFVNIFTMEEEYLLLVINDVTEEREKQERLYLTDRLVSVGEMAAGVAHEINNPLTSVIGLSSMLTKQDVPNDVKEDLHAIYSEAQRCASIVKNLLTFARKHVSKKEPLHIEGIIADVLKLRAYEHRVNNIIVETAFPPDLPEVFADYFEIQQVFINIILNAEAAMIDAHGRGTLKISAKATNNHVTISFADDGPGISKENMRSIFNPFFTTKEVGKGTGLGLSICYGIVASHGGKIYAKSEFGKGATFVVELPTRGKSNRLNA